MKKFLSGLLAIVTALALASCAGYGNGDSSSSSSSGSSGTPSYLRFDDLGFDPVTATSSNENVVKASVEDEARAIGGSNVVKLISVGAGTATVKITGADSTSIDIIVVVGSDLRLTWSKKTGGEDDSKAQGFFWNVDDHITASTAATLTSDTEMGRVKATNGMKTVFATTSPFSITAGGTDYAICSRVQLSADATVSKKSLMFTVGSTATKIAIYAKNSSSSNNSSLVLAKEDGTELKKWTIPDSKTESNYVAYEFDATGAFTENTVVGIYNGEGSGGSGVNVKAVLVEPIVKEDFTPSTNNDTANTVEILGIVGSTVEVNKPDLATVEIAGGKIAITSVKAGTIDITVTDADGCEAKINATITSTGSINLGTITKYEAAAPVKDTDFSVSGLILTAINAIEYSKDSGSSWTALAATEKYTATEAGSVSVRFPAKDANHAAGKAASVTLSNGGSVDYTLDASKFTTIDSKISKDDAPVTPESSDADTAAAITALSLALGEGMRIDGSDTQRFNVGGSLQKNGKNAVIFTAPSSATTVEVHFYNTNADRTACIAEYSTSDATTGLQEGTKKTTGSTDDIVETFTITGGTKYMLGGSNGIWITKIVIK